MRPVWEAAGDRFDAEVRARGGAPRGGDRRSPMPVDPVNAPGLEVVPSALDHYFMVAREGQLFHGAISIDKERVVDVIPLMNAAVAGAAALDVISFALQLPRCSSTNGRRSTRTGRRATRSSRT